MSGTRNCSCHCGAFKFSVPEIERGLIACHCKDCQKVSGGAPAYLYPVTREVMDAQRAKAASHSVAGESGQPVRRYFCPDCGTPLWSEPDAYAKTAFIKAGVLDEVSGVDLDRAIWLRSRKAWHHLPEGIETSD